MPRIVIRRNDLPIQYFVAPHHTPEGVYHPHGIFSSQCILSVLGVLGVSNTKHHSKSAKYATFPPLKISVAFG